MMKGLSRLIWITLFTGLVSSRSFAITPITGTRIIYNLSTDTAAVIIQNNSPNNVKINAWVTNNNNGIVENFSVDVSNILMPSKTKSKITLQAKDKKIFHKDKKAYIGLTLLKRIKINTKLLD